MKTLYDLFRVGNIEYEELEEDVDRKIVKNNVATLEKEKDFSEHVLHIVNSRPEREVYMALYWNGATFTNMGLPDDMFYKIVGILDKANNKQL